MANKKKKVIDSADRPADEAEKARRRPVGLNWRWLLALVAVVLLALFIFEYVHTKNQLEAVKNPVTGLNQTQQIVSQVGRYVDLPANETPTLAKVTDVSKLQGNSIFKNAQNGDVVLVYPKSGWVLLYRPSTGKVIEFSPYQASNGQ